MKKILALILVLATVCFCMTSCNEDIIESLQKHKDEYHYRPTVIKELTLDFYIICDKVTEDAKASVQRQINQITKERFNTNLNIHYVEADSYDETVKGNLDTADLILINSKELMDYLSSNEKLADLAAFYDTDTYGSLNVTIAESLIDAATTADGKCYCVPNNHVITPYTYVSINIETIHKQYHEKLSDLRQLTTMESLEALATKLNLSVDKSDSGPLISSPICVYEGDYEDRVTEDDGYVCNILQYPTVDEEEVYSSAFAVVNQKGVDTERVFEIIYAFNTDEELRNLLQYGVEGIHYTSERDNSGNITNVTRKDDYLMDLLYTGDIFHAYYCSGLEYTAEVKENGVIQNRESVKAQASEK